MKICSYNIQFCKGRDHLIDPKRVADTIQSADIACLQEVDRFAARTDFVDQAKALGDAFPDYYWVYGPTVDALSSHFPTGNERRQFGNMVISRWPIVQSRHHLYTPKLGGANHLSVQLGLLETVVQTPFGLLRVHSTHLHHLSSELRLRQIAQLKRHLVEAPYEGSVISGSQGLDWGEELDEYPVPFEAVFCGDFNLLPGSQEYIALTGPEDPRRPGCRLQTLDGLADTWVLSGHAESDGVTYITDLETGAGKRIDYCFVTAQLARRIHCAWIDDDADASDHQPYWVELSDPS